jgi:hypothetical protein
VLRRDITVGRAGRWTAWPGRHEAGAPKGRDGIAAHFLAKDFRELTARDWLEISHCHQHHRSNSESSGAPPRVGADEARMVSPKHGRVRRCQPLVTDTSSYGRSRSSSTRSYTSRSMLQFFPTTRASVSRLTGSAEAKITASTRSTHSRHRSSGGRSSSSRS